jgi:hypothetical protein
MRHDTGPPLREVLSHRRLRNRRHWLLLAIPILVAIVLLAGLYWRRPQAKAATPVLAMGWRPVVSFSGHESTQTEAFAIATGQWRIKWSANPDSSAAAAAQAGDHKPEAGIRHDTQTRSPEKGQFRLVVHSLVSGRYVATAADQKGAGSGVFYLAEEPRQFFLVINSSGVEWNIRVEEGVSGEEENFLH